MEQKIAQSVYDFRKLREDGYVYVDKTAHLYPLLTRGSDSFYFISRPRRFGKSLMLSTLKYIFQGKRDLFKGLAIDKLDYDWVDYPILHFSFAGIEAKTVEAFEADFCTRVKKVLIEAECTWDEKASPGANFNQAITDLAKKQGKSVVVLVDEYDAPVGHALADIKLATAIRQDLADFYIQIKECASDIRFMMMTGVTKFAQLSVFSALNNLVDLTLDEQPRRPDAGRQLRLAPGLHGRGVGRQLRALAPSPRQGDGPLGRGLSCRVASLVQRLSLLPRLHDKGL